MSSVHSIRTSHLRIKLSLKICSRRVYGFKHKVNLTAKVAKNHKSFKTTSNHHSQLIPLIEDPTKQKRHKFDQTFRRSIQI